MATIRRKVKAAISNKTLGITLERFTAAMVEKRDKAYSNTNFLGLRQEIIDIKDKVIASLPEFVDKFTRAAMTRGANVFHAKTGAEARQYVLELARTKGVKKIVKSKSMTSEEIELNKFLEDAGIEIIETDLGEWIVQQLGQRPSHIIGPALHLNKYEVAEVFARRTGDRVTPEAEELVKEARRLLRQEFLQADMGITGANLLVAETGTAVIFTNEGNGRLVSSLPPVQVIIAGYDKLIPGIKDMLPFLRALPRSASGQTISAYVTMFTGPVEAWTDLATKPEDEEVQFPKKELHIILLDNGRLSTAADPVFKEALRCIRCASCLNVCPVYDKVGGHVFGHIYMGAIGTILTSLYHSEKIGAELQELCIGCGRCREYCPAGIDLPSLLLELRVRKSATSGLPWTQRTLLDILKNRRLFHRLLRIAGRLQKESGGLTGFIRHLPLYFTELAARQKLPPIAEKPFRDRLAENNLKEIKKLATTGESKRRTSFFAGCLIDFVYPEQGEAVFRVLSSHRVKVNFPQHQTCCGAPALYLGDLNTAKALAKQNIAAFEEDEYEEIVTACPTCATTLLKYPRLLEGELDWAERARQFALRVKDFSSYVFELQASNDLPDKVSNGVSITYHDPCHAKRYLGAAHEARELLLQQGFVLTEMKEADVCCGFGGSYSLKFPELSSAILARKVANIEATRAEIVATSCPGCIMQLRSGLEKKSPHIKVRHIAELLDRDK